MPRIKQLLVSGVSLLFLTAGCSLFDSSTSPSEKTAESEMDENGLISVEQYTGKQYGLSGHDEEEEIGLANREEVEEAAKSYMKEFYNTDVEVQRISGSPGAVTVIVRSTGEILFNTYVIVPVDIESETIEGENTFSDADQLEGAIKSGIYSYAYQSELIDFENELAQLSNEKDLFGLNEEAVAATRYTGYSTPYFNVVVANNILDSLLTLYLSSENPSDENWKELIEKESFDHKYIFVTVQLFEQKGSKPSRTTYEDIRDRIIQNERLPHGMYSVYLFKNEIDPLSASGNNDDAIEGFEYEDIKK